MRRRAFLGGMALTLLPGAGSAEQGSPPIVAFITPGRGPSAQRYFEALRRGLLEMGLVEQRTVAIEHYDFERNFERLPEVVAGRTQGGRDLHNHQRRRIVREGRNV